MGKLSKTLKILLSNRQYVAGEVHIELQKKLDARQLPLRAEEIINQTHQIPRRGIPPQWLIARFTLLINSWPTDRHLTADVRHELERQRKAANRHQQG